MAIVLGVPNFRIFTVQSKQFWNQISLTVACGDIMKHSFHFEFF